MLAAQATTTALALQPYEHNNRELANQDVKRRTTSVIAISGRSTSLLPELFACRLCMGAHVEKECKPGGVLSILLSF